MSKSTLPMGLVALLLLVLACSILPNEISAQDAQQCTTPGSCGNEEMPSNNDNGFIVVSSKMQRHVERALLTKTQNDDEYYNEYPSFGSMLDISSIIASTLAGSTGFGDKIAWIASLINRKLLIGDETPCTADQLNSEDVDDAPSCLIGATAENYVSVRGKIEVARDEKTLATEFGIVSKGNFLVGNIMDLDLGGRKFDTIVANGVLAAVDSDMDSKAKSMEDMDLVLERLISLLNPGGSLYLIGSAPLDEVEGPGGIGMEVANVLDAAKSLSGEYPKRNLPASWIERNLSRLGLNVHTSTLFPNKSKYKDLARPIQEAKEWVDELPYLSSSFKNTYYNMLAELQDRAVEATRDGPIFTGDHTYIIGAQRLPADVEES